MKREEEMELIRSEFMALKRVLNEKSIRWWCASKAKTYNKINIKGGVSLISEATGISRPRIHRGLKEMEIENGEESTIRLRKSGGGRKKNNGKSTESIG